MLSDKHLAFAVSEKILLFYPPVQQRESPFVSLCQIFPIPLHLRMQNLQHGTFHAVTVIFPPASDDFLPSVKTSARPNHIFIRQDLSEKIPEKTRTMHREKRNSARSLVWMREL